MENNEWMDAIVLTAIFRGNYISEFIRLEQMMDLFISTHFTKTDKLRDEFLKIIISDRLAFKNKKEILFEILELHHKKFLANNLDFKGNIGIANAMRNSFAHDKVDLTSKGMDILKNKKIRLIDATDKKQTVGDKDFADKMKMLLDCKNKIETLIRDKGLSSQT